MKNCKIAILGLLILAAVSCGRKADVKFKVSQAPERDVIVKYLDVNIYKVLDTVKTDASGSFRFKREIADGQPEFIYFYFGNTKIASLLLQNGDKVSVEADTLGNYTVTGSEESIKLQKVEKDFSVFLSDVISVINKAEGDSEEQVAALNRELSSKYVSYYREAVKYVMSNPHSLTVIPVLYQNINENLPVFNQMTDAIHFRSACDSLKKIYPKSVYVKALDKDAVKRENLLALNFRVKNTEQKGFPDITLPDVNGEKVALSSLKSKIVLVMFWSAVVAEQKMYNIEELLPLYNGYHSKGFDVYSINLDMDKTLWGTTVRNQKLPWVNVCDGLGTSSPAVSLYNVTSVPSFYLIKDGMLVTDQQQMTGGLSEYLKKNL